MIAVDKSEGFGLCVDVDGFDLTDEIRAALDAISRAGFPGARVYQHDPDQIGIVPMSADEVAAYKAAPERAFDHLPRARA